MRLIRLSVKSKGCPNIANYKNRNVSILTEPMPKANAVSCRSLECFSGCSKYLENGLFYAAYSLPRSVPIVVVKWFHILGKQWATPSRVEYSKQLTLNRMLALRLQQYIHFETELIKTECQKRHISAEKGWSGSGVIEMNGNGSCIVCRSFHYISA